MNRPSARTNYILTIELGLVLSLAVGITAFNLDIRGSAPPVFDAPRQDLITIEDIPQVRMQEEPPPPARPSTPVVVDDSEIIADEQLALDPITYEPPVEIGAPPVADTPSEPEEPPFFVVVEKRPELIGGLASLQRQIRYPDFARRAGVQGRVTVEFIVDTDGSVTDLVVLKGIGAGCDEEAVRVLRDARFTPGLQRGKAVRVKMSLPIAFRLR